MPFVGEEILVGPTRVYGRERSHSRITGNPGFNGTFIGSQPQDVSERGKYESIRKSSLSFRGG